MELQNSYILIYKDNTTDVSSDVNTSIKHSIVISTVEVDPIRDYLFSFFANVKITEKISGFYSKYKCRLKHNRSYDITIISRNVKGDFYIDVIVSGNNKERIIKKMEAIHTAFIQSKVDTEYTFIVSFDSISEYYSNKMIARLNEFERKFRQLLYMIYTVRYRNDYIQFSFVNVDTDKRHKIIERLKKQNNNLLEHFFEEFEFRDYKALLFSAINPVESINVDGQSSYINENNDWDKYIANKVTIDTVPETLISKIQKPRNTIAHFKSISKKDYLEFIDTVNQLIPLINRAIELTPQKDFMEQYKKRIYNDMNIILGKLNDIIELYFNL
jgi:hypothetical protein